MRSDQIKVHDSFTSLQLRTLTGFHFTHDCIGVKQSNVFMYISQISVNQHFE